MWLIFWSGREEEYHEHKQHVNAIPAEEITISIFLYAYPRELFQLLEATGATITEESSGIHRIDRVFHIPIRIIVIKNLRSENAPLRILAKDISEQDIRDFSTHVEHIMDKDDMENIESILEVSIAANRQLYNHIKEANDMGPVLQDFFKDEFAAARKQGEQQGEARGEKRGEQKATDNLIERLLRRGETPESISDFNDFPLADIHRVQRNMNMAK